MKHSTTAITAHITACRPSLSVISQAHNGMPDLIMHTVTGAVQLALLPAP